MSKTKAEKLNELSFKSLERSRRYEGWKNNLCVRDTSWPELSHYHIYSLATGRLYDVCEHSRRVEGSYTRIFYTLSEVDSKGCPIKHILVGHNNGAVTSTETGCEIIATYEAVMDFMYREDMHELYA